MFFWITSVKSNPLQYYRGVRSSSCVDGRATYLNFATSSYGDGKTLCHLCPRCADSFVRSSCRCRSGRASDCQQQKYKENSLLIWQHVNICLNESILLGLIVVVVVVGVVVVVEVVVDVVVVVVADVDVVSWTTKSGEIVINPHLLKANPMHPKIKLAFQISFSSSVPPVTQSKKRLKKLKQHCGWIFKLTNLARYNQTRCLHCNHLNYELGHRTHNRSRDAPVCWALDQHRQLSSSASHCFSGDRLGTMLDSRLCITCWLLSR